MLDLRVVATTLVMLAALVSVSLADSVKDKSPEIAKEKAQPVVSTSVETRPIRVILPASWEPSKGQTEIAK